MTIKFMCFSLQNKREERYRNFQLGHLCDLREKKTDNFLKIVKQDKKSQYLCL